MAAALRYQKKGDLQNLASAAGFANFETLNREDLMVALDEHLQKYAAQLSHDPAFEFYYGRSSSPTGGRATISADGATKYEIRGRGRRSTRIKDDVETVPSPTKPTFSPTKTAPPPARFSSTTQSSQAWDPRPPSPISPAAVADAIEATESQLAASISSTWQRSRAHELLHRARAVLSTPAGVHLTFIALESIGLQRSIWPAHYAFSTPALPLLRLPSLPVSLPNPFYLLTSHFWAPALLWAATSFLLPLLVAWFFNLSVRARQPRSSSSSGKRSDALPLPPILQQQQQQQQQQQPKHPLDPATFAIAKTLLTYLVFSD
ncbi:hypothetical protein LTR28_010347, partial [Elasticomyces elasticus]